VSRFRGFAFLAVDSDVHHRLPTYSSTILNAKTLLFAAGTPAQSGLTLTALSRPCISRDAQVALKGVQV
jgi:hypothetical protein